MKRKFHVFNFHFFISSIVFILGAPLPLPETLFSYFSYKNLDFKARIWVKGREGKGREGKGREGKGREGKGREGKGREGKGREGKGRENAPTETGPLPESQAQVLFVHRVRENPSPDFGT